MNGVSQLLDSLNAASSNWQAQAQFIGAGVVGALSAIELTFWLLRAGLSAGRQPDLVGVFLRKLIYAIFAVTVIWTYPTWMGALQAAVQGTAKQVGGFGHLNPTVVMDTGFHLSFTLLKAGGVIGLLFGKAIATALVLFLAVTVLVAFLFYGLILAKTLLEAWFSLSLGALFLAFGSNRFTVGIADGFLTYTLRVHIALFLQLMIVGATSQVVNIWANLQPTDLLNPDTIIFLVFGAVSLAVFAWQIPKRLTDAIFSSYSPGLRELFQRAQ